MEIPKVLMEFYSRGFMDGRIKGFDIDKINRAISQMKPPHDWNSLYETRWTLDEIREALEDYNNPEIDRKVRRIGDYQTRRESVLVFNRGYKAGQAHRNEDVSKTIKNKLLDEERDREFNNGFYAGMNFMMRRMEEIQVPKEFRNKKPQPEL